jgi:hypothetical protein
MRRDAGIEFSFNPPRLCGAAAMKTFSRSRHRASAEEKDFFSRLLLASSCIPPRFFFFKLSFRGRSL